MATLAAIADVISAVEVAGVDLESCEYDGAQFTIPMDGLNEGESGELADALADLGVEGEAGVFSFLDESEDEDPSNGIEPDNEDSMDDEDLEEYADEDFEEEDPEDDDDFDDEDDLEGDDPEDF